jgi:hypothetical protein
VEGTPLMILSPCKLFSALCDEFRARLGFRWTPYFVSVPRFLKMIKCRLLDLGFKLGLLVIMHLVGCRCGSGFDLDHGPTLHGHLQVHACWLSDCIEVLPTFLSTIMILDLL